MLVAHLGRICRDGMIYAVDRATGEVLTLTLAEYTARTKAGALDNYIPASTAQHAEAFASGVQARLAARS
jgi:glucose dehydrogenase